MTKKELADAILKDMIEKSGDAIEAIQRRFRGWLMRQTKETLETIYRNRKIG